MPAIAIEAHRKKRFCDFADEPTPLDGEKIKIEAVLNQELEITGFKIGATRYSKNKSGKYMTLQITHNNKRRILFTGSDVLINQMERYQNEIPFIATILQINKYYTLS